MSEWLDVPDNVAGLWERKFCGHTKWCDVRKTGVVVQYRVAGTSSWHTCGENNTQFRRLHTGSQEEVENGKAVVALKKRLKEMETRPNSTAITVSFAADGFCSAPNNLTGVFATAYSLPALLEQLTKPEPLVWDKRVVGKDNTEFFTIRGSTYSVFQVVDYNRLRWAVRVDGEERGGSCENSTEAKAVCQAHSDSRTE